MCWRCGSPVVEADPIGRSLRRGVCAESGAENASAKERANFCDWFALDPKFRSASAASASTAARTAFDNLFT
ncbi:MAG: hypothetical protein LBG43_10655 [Treponema sp.]|nr:hypothetical protein [Treponema sp.]